MEWVLFYFVDLQNNDTSPAVKSLLSLMSPCAFSLGTSILNFAEQTHGINWSNISDAEVSKVRCSSLHVPRLNAANIVMYRSITPLGSVLLMLAFDTLFYFFLAYYTNQVRDTGGCSVCRRMRPLLLHLILRLCHPNSARQSIPCSALCRVTCAQTVAARFLQSASYST